jgi:hypothetical protein
VGGDSVAKLRAAKSPPQWLHRVVGEPGVRA